MSYKKNIHKISNIALIFMLVGVFLCQDIGFGYNLRTHLGYSLYKYDERYLIARRNDTK